MPALPPALTQLDAAEIVAVAENLASSQPAEGEPPARIVSESLCCEIEKIIVLLAREVAAHERSHPEQ